MKKILLFAMGAILGTGVSAQTIKKSPITAINNRATNLLDEQNVLSSTKSNRASRAAGDTVWMEDFANGIPAGWSLSGADNVTCPWKYSHVGSVGFYNGGNYPASAPAMNSASAANGFLICDPDSANHNMYGQPSGTTYQYLESYITTAAIDLTGQPSVRLEFEHSFRYNNSPDLLVSVSTDGVTWTDFTAQGNVDANQASADPETFSADVSSLIGGSSTAYIKIGWSARVYYWMVDDIRLTVPPANDLVLKGNYYQTNRDTGTSQYYTRIPLSQAVLETIQFSGNVENTGSALQTNTMFTNGVTTPAGFTAYNSNSSDIASGDTDSLIISNSFTFSDGLGQYSFAYSTASDSVDSNPNDNVFDTVIVEVTDSTYSRDLNGVGNYWYGAGSSFEIGPMFDVFDTVKATSVSLAVGENSVAGEAISIYIYDGSLTTPITSREFIILDSADVGTLVTYDIPEVLLTPGQYIVTYKTYSDQVFFRRSAFTADAQTCFVDVSASGTWGWTTSVPVVRLNVSENLHVCDLAATAVQTGNNTGLAQATGGTAPFTYLWSDGQTTASATNLTSDVSPGYCHTVTITDDSACTATAEVCIITGIIEAGIKGEVTMYPNPNNGNFQLNLENVAAGSYELKVTNMLGQNVYTDKVNVAGSYNTHMNIPTLTNGIYFLEISNDSGEKSVLRFIVE
ncbi:MAG: T9SS type A sorting domain-containing protein [Salibacteraceae bacterium]